MEPATKANRIEWIDMTKGLIMPLVIIGHTVSSGFTGSITRGLIFSFHMPLFFILSCLTYRCSTDAASFNNKTLKAARHLLIPILFVWIVNYIYLATLIPEVVLTRNYFKSYLYTLFFASGVDGQYSNISYTAIGIPWFFSALFFGRTIFDWIHMNFEKKQVAIICCIISLLGIALGSAQWLPLSLDIAMAVVVFFYIGNSLKSYDITKRPMLRLIIFGALWIITLFITFPDVSQWTYLELACRRYSVFPLCYITAFFGTMFFCEIGYIFSKIPYITKPFAYIGKNSIYLLIIHCLDGVFYKLYVNYQEQGEFKLALARLISNLIVFAIVMLVVEIMRAAKRKLAART